MKVIWKTHGGKMGHVCEKCGKTIFPGEQVYIEITVFYGYYTMDKVFCEDCFKKDSQSEDIEIVKDLNEYLIKC